MRPSAASIAPGSWDLLPGQQVALESGGFTVSSESLGVYAPFGTGTLLVISCAGADY